MNKFQDTVLTKALANERVSQNVVHLAQEQYDLGAVHFFAWPKHSSGDQFNRDRRINSNEKVRHRK